MKEISMHILDIVMNSIKAKATLIELYILDSKIKNVLKIIIKDNGTGMSKETATRVINPFFTTRLTRKVGLGIPLLKEACERCNGNLSIKSILGEGTTLECFFEKDNIDRAPLGNMGDTVMTIINSLDDCELIYRHNTDFGSFELSTAEVKNMLENVNIKEPDIMLWIKEYVNENISGITNN